MAATYTASGFKTPTTHDIKHAAAGLGLSLSEDEISNYQDLMQTFNDAYTETLNAVEPNFPVKYPRTPGYRPSANENHHNAWYWKIDIKGASSGLLSGKRIAIKDNVAVAGVPMMNGSRVMEGYVPEFDATVVTRILDQGGHIVGKAVCEDLCISGGSSYCATGPVTNPHDEERTAGGSSSGSAVLVAIGEVDMAIGGDQGGSIRGPASFCGIVGLKPTFGLIPYTGAISIEPSVDHLGPMANTVKDVALLLQAIAGSDGHDFRQNNIPKIPNYTDELSGNIKGLRIGAINEGFLQCDKSVVDIVKSSIHLFEDLEANTEWISIPELPQAEKYYIPLIYHGLCKTAKEGEGIGYGYRGHYCSSMGQHIKKGLSQMANDLSMPVQVAMLFGSYIQENYGNLFYNKSQNMRCLMISAFDKMLEKYDVLFLPTKKQPADILLKQNASPKEAFHHCFKLSNYMGVFNYTGHPALSINVGDIQGLPVGATIVGKMFDDATVLNVAYALEQEILKRKP